MSFKSNRLLRIARACGSVTSSMVKIAWAEKLAWSVGRTKSRNFSAGSPAMCSSGQFAF